MNGSMCPPLSHGMLQWICVVVVTLLLHSEASSGNDNGIMSQPAKQTIDVIICDGYEVVDR